MKEQKPSAYHLLTAAEKQATTRANIREQALRCPACDVATTATDLIAHVRQRCPGRPEPHAHAAWVSIPQAIALGVPESIMQRIVSSRVVRTRGETGRREYLLRDVAFEVARLAMTTKRSSEPAPPGGPGGLGSSAAAPCRGSKYREECPPTDIDQVSSLVTSEAAK